MPKNNKVIFEKNGIWKIEISKIRIIDFLK